MITVYQPRAARIWRSILTFIAAMERAEDDQDQRVIVLEHRMNQLEVALGTLRHSHSTPHVVAEA